MNADEIIKLINLGETSMVQFKERMPHVDSLTAELIAFSNSKGGVIIFGVNNKTGELNGLSFDEVRNLNQQLVNASSTKVYQLTLAGLLFLA
jgi:predicted HTH transcriptional regulator